VALGAVTLLALALRIVGIDQTLYSDEDFTFNIVRDGGLGHVFDRVYHTSITPPFHYVVAWLSVQYGGDESVLVRMPSLLCGTALVPLVFVLARRIGGSLVGLLAALLVALSPFAIWYSDEARAYALMMFLVALSTLAMLRAVEGGGRRWWVLYGASACLALYSHYTAVFVVAAEALWALWVHRERMRPLLYTQAAIAVAYLPWVPGFLEQRKNKVGIEVISAAADLTAGRVFGLPLRTVVGHPYYGFPVFPGTKGWLLVAVVVVLIVVVAATRTAALRELVPSLRSEWGLTIILVLATPIGLLLYSAVSSSLFIPRNLSASMPALAIAFAFVLQRLAAAAPRWLGVAGVAVFIGVMAMVSGQSLEAKYRRPPYREAARWVDRHARPGDPVIETPLALVRDPRLPPTTLGVYFQRPHPLYRSGTGDVVAWRQLAGGRSVFLVSTSQFVGARPLERALSQGPVRQKAPPGMLSRIEMTGGPDGRALVRRSKFFPGIIPVTAVEYRGLAQGRLERVGGRELISWTFGRRVTVAPGAARGSVELLARSFVTPLLVSGWALDPARRAPVDWVLLFAGNRLFAVARPGPRPDIAGIYGRSALVTGFLFAPRTAPADLSSLRAFAIVGDRASELPLSPAVKRSLRSATP
jgi:4-amino-4-deoxy-L-arabinose transferase-like glycosyltransferase